MPNWTLNKTRVDFAKKPIIISTVYLPLATHPPFQRRLLSAAQPTYQGEESVVLVVIVVGGDYFLISHVQFFGVCKAKTLSRKGCEKHKTLSQ